MLRSMRCTGNFRATGCTVERGGADHGVLGPFLDKDEIVAYVYVYQFRAGVRLTLKSTTPPSFSISPLVQLYFTV